MDMARQSKTRAVPVLLTRPEAEARAFAEALVGRLAGRVRPVVAPLMAVEPIEPTLPAGRFAGVIFTSAAGVDASRRLKAALPELAWCVGARTADRAAAAGFQARSAHGDADALVVAILADRPRGRLLHLRGEDTRGNVAERLNSAGIETESVVVYRQASQPLTAEGAALLQAAEPVIVPLFSPRSARLFAELAGQPKAELHLVGMSAAVAAAAGTISHRSLIVARRPDAESMLDAVEAALVAASAP
jgi:uroporphyrinogen-III synthase